MAKQTIDDLTKLVTRLDSGMSIKLPTSAFAHYFGKGQAGWDAATQFANDNRCIAIIGGSRESYSVELIRK